MKKDNREWNKFFFYKFFFIYFLVFSIYQKSNMSLFREIRNIENLKGKIIDRSFKEDKHNDQSIIFTIFPSVFFLDMSVDACERLHILC